MGLEQPLGLARETTTYTLLRAQAAFYRGTREIYAKITSLPFPSASELRDLDAKLTVEWYSTLPPFLGESCVQAPKFKLCHAVLWWRYMNFLILMYRPFLIRKLMVRPQQGTLGPQNRDDPTERAIERCLEAVRHSVYLISAFWTREKKSMLACWYGSKFLAQAILIPIISLRNDPQGNRMNEKWNLLAAGYVGPQVNGSPQPLCVPLPGLDPFSMWAIP